MKQIISIILCNLFALNFVQAEKLPEFVRQKLDSVKKEANRCLIEYRNWDIRTDGYMTLPLGLGFYSYSPDMFSYEETQFIDSLQLNLSIEMVYDDEMRDRLVQLMRNEYMEWELDFLVNKRINNDTIRLRAYAMNACRFDTLALFKTTLDSFFMDTKNKSTEDFRKHLEEYESFYKEKYKSEVFKLLELDTTEIFKHAYNEIVTKEKEIIRADYLANAYYYDYTHLAELCGYIGDQRFIKPLIEALNNPNNFQREKVIEALVRMKVEPYYTEYVQKRTRTIDSIKKKKPDFDIEELVYVIRTQKSFLELSKYLISDVAYNYIAIDLEEGSYYKPNPMYNKAFDWISINLENKDLKGMIGNKYPSENPEIVKPVYDWMQKNYGKYQLKKIW
jgi:hypothetical protein